MTAAALGTNRLVIDRNRAIRAISNFFIGLAVFLGGFVLFEPAPYELLLAVLLGVGLLCGLRIPRGVLPIIILFALYCVGGLVSSFQMADYGRGLHYTTVTFFLSFTAAFFAILINQDMGRLRLIFRFYVAGAILTTLPGIFGYFGIPGFEIFTRYERAQGVFADPNVYAPFLVAPALYLMYGIMHRSITMLPARMLGLAILLLGLLLAFSRAGWGLLVIAAGIFYFLMLVNETNPRTRVKYILQGLIGLCFFAGALIVALQFDAISTIFEQRAQVIQSYDGDRLGRFARHLIGFELALTEPLGIGPLEFGFLYGEDTHNVYLKGLMGFGWLGFVCWMIMIFWTLIAGFKLLFNKRPWQPYYQIAYIVFFGHLIIGWVIDVDHWRHFYLMLGIIWGCILLEKKWHAERKTAPKRPMVSLRRSHQSPLSAPTAA